MRNRLPILVMFFCLMGLPAAAQHKTPAKAKAATTTPARPDDSAKLPSEDEVNAFMHAMFGYDPQLTWKIESIRPSEAEGLAEVNVALSGPQGQGGQQFFVSRDGQHAVVGNIIPFGAHPFERARQQLQKEATGPSRGPANAPVQLVEFFDLQCPHCKEANPTIEKLVNDDPNVHFVSENFPIVGHNWATKAASYADCVGRASNEAYWKFVDTVFDAQNDITADNVDQKLTDFADKSGVKGSDIATCAATPGTQSRVEASTALGRSVDVTATPTLFINGRPVGVSNNNYDVLKQLVDFAAKEK